MKLRVGCGGWSYSNWVGPFYPTNTSSLDYLKLYSRVFDIVEIDSSFYRNPSPRQVSHWRNSTPDDFLFSAKLPKSITHDKD
ncbi:MAG: DUF72 domain-containing protein [Candidatus Bathyarchaeia archaeon]